MTPVNLDNLKDIAEAMEDLIDKSGRKAAGFSHNDVAQIRQAAAELKTLRESLVMLRLRQGKSKLAYRSVKVLGKPKVSDS